MSEYDIMMFPGGFSYGDDTGSGNAFANRLKNNLWKELLEFVGAGKPILGVCNGFQIMTYLGLFALPEVDGGQYGQIINALESNNSNRYECRWVNIKTNHQDNNDSNRNDSNHSITLSKCIFTKNISMTHIPIAHGEGRFVCDKKTLDALKKNNQIVFIYCDEDGRLANGVYPINPNGALSDIAAICDRTGKIMGMMPHPERSIYSLNEPEFHLKKEIAKRSGKQLPKIIESNFLIFKNAVEFVKNKSD